jgi:hypothetical protein
MYFENLTKNLGILKELKLESIGIKKQNPCAIKISDTGIGNKVKVLMELLAHANCQHTEPIAINKMPKKNRQILCFISG